MHALITGASAGIGEALAVAFAGRGYDVTLAARREAELERVAGRCGDVEARVEAVDLSDLANVAPLVKRAVEALGPIDLLVNNAGVQIVARTEEVDPEAGERLLTINLLAPMRLTRAVLPGMLDRGAGTIVDIASLAALAPTPGMYHYSASKSAIAAASESLRGEVRSRGVHVVTVYPGPIATEMADRAVDQYAADPTKGLPVGTTEALARRVVRAVERKRARVIYPRSYGAARSFPGLTQWVMETFSPLPEKRLGRGSEG